MVFDNDGTTSIFDFKNSKNVKTVEMKERLEGIWWIDKYAVILGFNILTGDSKFFHYSVKTGLIKNISDRFNDEDAINIYSKKWYLNNLLKKI